MEQQKPISRNLAHELASDIENMLDESSRTFSDWWKIAIELKEARYKLIERIENMTDANYRSMAETLIVNSFEAYNNIISVFINGGIAQQTLRENKARERKIQVIHDIIHDTKKKND